MPPLPDGQLLLAKGSLQRYKGKGTSYTHIPETTKSDRNRGRGKDLFWLMVSRSSNVLWWRMHYGATQFMVAGVWPQLFTPWQPERETGRSQGLGINFKGPPSINLRPYLLNVYNHKVYCHVPENVLKIWASGRHCRFNCTWESSANVGRELNRQATRMRVKDEN